MVMHSSDTKRDTLGRVFKTQPSPELNDARISGDRDSIRAGVAHRFDDRKGAELLNSKHLGRHEGPRGAPLDGLRTKRGDGLQVAADLFPLDTINPAHRAELSALFRNPAVVRAYLVNPDATTRLIGERNPELETILEAHAPFSFKDGIFSVNTTSPMYRSIVLAEQLGASPTATRLYKELDRLHTSARGTALGGAAGIETSTYSLLASCVRNGFESERTAHAAAKVQTMMRTGRAQEDLQIVASLRGSQHRAVDVTTPTVTHEAPIYIPKSAPQEPQRPPTPSAIPQLSPPQSQPEALPIPAASAPPSISTPVAPPLAPEMTTPPREAQRAPQKAVPEPAPPIPPAPLPPADLPKETPPLMKVADPAPAPSVAMTPTMQRLVDVVNNSTLERQIGSPRNNPILEFSDRDHDTLKKMLTNPATKQELLGYSDDQLKAAFQEVRPERIKYLEEWLAMNHRDAVRHPGLARSMAGITPQDTNRIGQVVGIARSVADERAVK